MRVIQVLKHDLTRTEVDITSLTLTRVIGSNICTICMKHKNSIEDLDRFTKLSDEDFERFSYIQEKKK